MYACTKLLIFSLVSNASQEYLTRPTAKAAFWDEPNTHVLGGRDLQREVRGTWLGITKQGRIAVLTNFRENGNNFSGVKSRGAMVNSFLTTPPDSEETTEQFAKRLVEDVGVTDVGGFSLVFGKLVPFDSEDSRPGLAIVSNRSEHISDITWISETPDQVHALSNAHFSDRSWPKVLSGEKLTHQAIESNVQQKTGKEALVASLFEILSLDTLPRRKHGEDWEAFIRQLRHSIFIPRLGGEEIEKSAPEDIAAATPAEETATTSDDGLYGTQKQTIVLVDKLGRVTFIEKTLYNEKGEVTEDSVEEFSFDIEGWGV